MDSPDDCLITIDNPKTLIQALSISEKFNFEQIEVIKLHRGLHEFIRSQNPSTKTIIAISGFLELDDDKFTRIACEMDIFQRPELKNIKNSNITVLILMSNEDHFRYRKLLAAHPAFRNMINGVIIDHPDLTLMFRKGKL